METDLRSSWGSDRSADVAGWRSLQARLREEADAGDGVGTPLGGGGVRRGSLAGKAASLRRQADMATDEGPASGGRCTVARSTADGEAGSLRSSLEGPACSDRQGSLLPLRASLRPHQWGSHLASPPGCDGASPDPLLAGHGGPSSSGGSRQRAGRSSGNSVGGLGMLVQQARVAGVCPACSWFVLMCRLYRLYCLMAARRDAPLASTTLPLVVPPLQKWGCFSCASPFSCKQRPASGDDSDDEVVRRNADSVDDFVIRRKQSFPPPPSPARERTSSGRLK